MRTRWIVAFMKDIRNFTIGYFISNILIILFYYLSVREKVEILYPCIISVFIYCIVIAIEWIKHYSFHKTITNCVENQEFDLKTVTEEQKRVHETIENIHMMYLSQIDSLIIENERKHYIITQWVHNIKTSISVIDLILQKANLTNSIDQNVLDNIKEENDKSIEQLEKLLTIIRLDHFSKDYMIEPSNLTEQVFKVINRKKNQFVYNKVFPKVLIDNKEYIILTDQKWNELMLEQIISNAIKYSNVTNQNKFIYFSIIQEGKWTKLSIRDEGIGISEYDQHRIFEPFVTGDNGRIMNGSTGIGLYICRTIADHMGHRISVESKKGEGSIFTISYLSKL
jgi:signal transduction histidine kinase